MTYTLFISDLHLAPDHPDITRALKTLLANHAGKARALYILGDLFESWIGDDDDDAFNEEVVSALASFSGAGSALFFIHGNRDFLLGERFAERCGGILLHEPTVIDLYGTPTLILHGDELCTDDHDYQQFRQLVRSSAWQQNILSKPLAERRMIAQFLRMKSAGDNANKAENIMDVNADAVQQTLAHHGVSQMIHGHTHRPAIHTLPDGRRRIVLGDWYSQGWFLQADADGQQQLLSFPIDSAEAG